MSDVRSFPHIRPRCGLCHNRGACGCGRPSSAFVITIGQLMFAMVGDRMVIALVTTYAHGAA